MEIVVLLKPVPATESLIQVADDGVSIRSQDLKWVINPYDEYAVEEALRMREKQGGSVTLLTLGGEKSVEIMRKALAMGADKGVLIQDPAALDRDGLGSARILAAALKTLPHDLIVAGLRAVDDDNYLVGTAVAEFLGIPNLSMVTRVEAEADQITCQRDIEGGSLTLKAKLPALFTAQRGLNEPRYVSMPGIMKAKKKPIEKKSLADIGMSPDDPALQPKTRIKRMALPAERGAGKQISEGSPEEKAAELVRLLREEARVI